MVGPRLIRAIALRPRLWGEAVRTYGALVPRAWWAASPRLPVPDKAYTDWRIATAYGSVGAEADPADVVAFLEWRRRYRRVTGGKKVRGG